MKNKRTQSDENAVCNYNSASSPPQLFRAAVSESEIINPIQPGGLNRDLLKRGIIKQSQAGETGLTSISSLH